MKMNMGREAVWPEMSRGPVWTLSLALPEQNKGEEVSSGPVMFFFMACGWCAPNKTNPCVIFFHVYLLACLAHFQRCI